MTFFPVLPKTSSKSDHEIDQIRCDSVQKFDLTDFKMR